MTGPTGCGAGPAVGAIDGPAASDLRAGCSSRGKLQGCQRPNRRVPERSWCASPVRAATLFRSANLHTFFSLQATSQGDTREAGLMGSNEERADTVFDLQMLRRLLKMMSEYELTEIDLRSGTQQIRLRKQQPGVVSSNPGFVPYAPMAVPAAAGPMPAPGGAAANQSAANQPTSVAEQPEQKQEEPARKYLEITSPMLGTFYRASAPDADPFVEVGSHVEPDTVVCIIEAMKVFNEITADVRGKIVEILVENGQPVEYGQTLFLVDPTE